MEKINFTDATETSSAYVTVDGKKYDVNPAQYNGGTDLNASTFNELQDNIEEAIKEVYSTEEQVIGTWIDGKPIYRKVFTTTTQSDAMTENTLITNPVSNLDTLVKIDGLIKSNNYWKINQQYDPTGSNTNYFATYYYNVNNNDIRGQVGNTLTSKPITFILEYTKTTD